jgi:hypothetical protein
MIHEATEENEEELGETPVRGPLSHHKSHMN